MINTRLECVMADTGDKDEELLTLTDRLEAAEQEASLI